MKYGPKLRIRERSKMCGFPMIIQQLWNVCKIEGSAGVANFEYFPRNMKDCEQQSTSQKIRHSQNACNYCRFWKKIDDDAPRQKSGSPRMLTITVVFEECWWYRRCERHDAVSHFEYGRDYSSILRPKRWGTNITQYVSVSFAGATARFWKVPNRESQRHRSFTEEHRRPHREAKPLHPNELRVLS